MFGVVVPWCLTPAGGGLLVAHRLTCVPTAYCLVCSGGAGELLLPSCPQCCNNVGLASRATRVWQGLHLLRTLHHPTVCECIACELVMFFTAWPLVGVDVRVVSQTIFTVFTTYIYIPYFTVCRHSVNVTALPVHAAPLSHPPHVWRRTAAGYWPATAALLHHQASVTFAPKSGARCTWNPNKVEPRVEPMQCVMRTMWQHGGVFA